MQPHVENGLGLSQGEVKAFDQTSPGLLGITGRTNRLDDLVEVVEGLDEALQQVGLLFCFPQFVAGPAGDHIPSVVHKAPQHVLEAQYFGLAAHDGEHIHAESGLHGRVGEELVENDPADGIALELDNYSHSLAIRFITQVRDALDHLVLDQTGNLLHQFRFVYLVGKLDDNDGLAVRSFVSFDVGPGPHPNQPPARLVGLPDALNAKDEAGGGKVGSRYYEHQLVDGDIRVLDDLESRIDDLPHVVGRNIGGHTDRNTGRAVDQQSWEAGRQHQGLLQRTIIVVREIDGFLVQVGKHLRRQPPHTNFGVSHGCRRVTVNGTEVPLAIHELITHGEVLGHANDGIVHRLVAVGMILTNDVAHDTGALLVGTLPGVLELVHREKHPAMHRLQSVPHVGQSTPDDHAHGVIYVGVPDFLFDRRDDLVLRHLSASFALRAIMKIDKEAA